MGGDGVSKEGKDQRCRVSLGQRNPKSCSWHLSNAKGSGCGNREERIIGGERREVMSILIMFFIFGILRCFDILGLC